MQFDPTLYVITDSTYHTTETLLRAVDEACRGGATLIQLREKDTGGRSYLELAQQVKSVTDRYSVPLIIDASQSAGSLPIDFSVLAPAFLAMPGHKGLYGPQGTGLLLCGSDALPLIEGGTGSESLRQSMPDFLPDRLEAGTHNVPGIAGLEAGIAFVRAQRPERILHHSRALIRRAGEGLGKIPNVHGFLSLEASLQAGVLSFTVDGLSPESVAEEMAKRGIALRAGLHCAPFAHKTVGTLPDGTVRLSVSAFNRESEIDTFLSSLRAIAAGQAKN